MTEQELINYIVELTKQWYEIVNYDHHKDRDCHWYINTEFSYGQEPVYIVRHYGYVYKEVEYQCGSYSFALLRLKQELEYAINEETNRFKD